MENFWDQTKVDDGLMRLYISHPGESKPLPAVVVVQHQGGVDEFVQQMTRLAKPQMWDFPMRRGPIW
ncbi:MAG: hypothetical protein HYT78_20900 [Deltaproteobacteria bacterium]|nr:hypothetical protein [Deltaproteobacteria bacterium]